jgi:8-oxo-dGTP diphosphatase
MKDMALVNQTSESNASDSNASDSNASDSNASDTSQVDSRPFTEVAVGLVHRVQPGHTDLVEVLMGQRPPGKPYAGWWEFPGGKIEPGESVALALARELHEELALQVDASVAWVVRTHSYPHARVRLHFRRIFVWSGAPVAMEQQAFAWQSLDRITLSPLLPAALPLLDMLRWPARVVLLGFTDQPDSIQGLERALADSRLRAGDRVLIRMAPLTLSPQANGATMSEIPDVKIQLWHALGLAKERGLCLYLEQAWFDLAPHVNGVWSTTSLEGLDCLEVSASDRFFDTDSDATALSPRALILLDSKAQDAHYKRIAEGVELPLYWPRPELLSLGGHGHILWLV